MGLHENYVQGLMATKQKCCDYFLELKDYARLQTSGILVGVVFYFLYTVFNKFSSGWFEIRFTNLL